MNGDTMGTPSSTSLQGERKGLGLLCGLFFCLQKNADVSNQRFCFVLFLWECASFVNSFQELLLKTEK